MATGILMGRNPPLKPAFQLPTSTGINRVPAKLPLDPEKLLNLGLDLTINAREKVNEACDLFALLEWLARLNRTILEDEDVVKVLTDLREDAEVLVERGLYALDVAQEIRIRLGNHNPEHGEIVTRESSRRWQQCFYALSGIWSRTYISVYGRILAAPTCGDLSHIPPKLHFEQPSQEASKRYNYRLSVAVGGNFPLVVDYWRCRLVKGIEAGELPGRVTLKEEVRRWPKGRVTRLKRYEGDGYSELVGHNTYIEEGLAELAGPDYTSFVDITEAIASVPASPKSPSLPSDPDSPEPSAPSYPRMTPGGTTRLETITEGSIDQLMGTPAGISTPKNYPAPENPSKGPLQGPIAKSAQAGPVRTSRRLQQKRESKAAAPKEPEPPAPPKTPGKRKCGIMYQEPAEESAIKKQTTKKAAPAETSKAPTKRKRGAETAAQSSGYTPRPKRPRVRPLPTKLKLKLTQEQDMGPLTDSEMAQLPWNKNKPAAGEVDPSKYVFPVAGFKPIGPPQMADIRGWAENRLPKVYDKFKNTDDEVTPADLADTAESEVSDYMDIAGDDLTDAEDGDTGHGVDGTPAQGDTAPSPVVEEELYAAPRPAPVPELIDSPKIDIPPQFEDPRQTEIPPPPLPQAPQIQQCHPELPSLRTRTPGIYKQFPTNEGIYSPNLNTSAFYRSSPVAKGGTPKGPGPSPSTSRQFTLEEVSFAEQSATEIGITTAEFLEGWSREEEEAASQIGDTTSKPAGDLTFPPSQQPSGEEPAATVVAEPSADRSSSPELPPPGGKPDTPDMTAPLGENNGLWGSTYLQEQESPKGPVSEAGEGQDAPGRGPSSGAPKPFTPQKAKDPSSGGFFSDPTKASSIETDQSLFGSPRFSDSEPCLPKPSRLKCPSNELSSESTTGASQIPEPSVYEGSTYMDSASRLQLSQPSTSPRSPSIGGRRPSETPPKAKSSSSEPRAGAFHGSSPPSLKSLSISDRKPSGTPSNEKSSSSEPTTGASQTPPRSVSDENAYRDPAFNFPDYSSDSPERYYTPPKAKSSSSEPTTGASQGPSPPSLRILSISEDRPPGTPPNAKSSSSEPTTGASQTPEPSVYEGSTYIDPASRLHFPEYPPPGTPSREEAEADSGGPPSGGSGKSQASVTSADRAVMHALLQGDLDEKEAEERKKTTEDLKQLVCDKAILRDAGIDPEGLSVQEVRDTAEAMRLSAHEEMTRRNSERQADRDTEMTDAPRGEQKQESEKGSKQKGSEKDAKWKKAQKDGEDEEAEGGRIVVTDAEWLEASNYQPERYDEREDDYRKDVWDI